MTSPASVRIVWAAQLTAESPALHKTIFEHAPGSRGAQDYEALLDELMADGFIG